MIEELRNYFKTHHADELEKTPFVMDYKGSVIEIYTKKYSFENGENQKLCEYTNNEFRKQFPNGYFLEEYVICLFIKIDNNYLVYETSKIPISKAYDIFHLGSYYNRNNQMVRDTLNKMITQVEEDISLYIFKKMIETL